MFIAKCGGVPESFAYIAHTDNGSDGIERFLYIKIKCFWVMSNAGIYVSDDINVLVNCNDLFI